MPAGGPGDDPVLDIRHWRQPVYSLAVDSLIAELAELWDGLHVRDFLGSQNILWMERTESELTRAESALQTKRDELYSSAQARGWDMESLDGRIKAEREAVATTWKGRSE